MVSLPSFAQCGGQDQSECDPLYDGEVISIGYRDPVPDPYFDPDPLPVNPPCEYDCDNGGGGDDRDPLVCFTIADRQPEDCDTDPGDSRDLDYSKFIDNNIDQILPTRTIYASYQDCIMGFACTTVVPRYPYMNEFQATFAVNFFSQAYYDTFDYISSRYWIYNLLVIIGCTDYSDDESALHTCAQSQADFLYSMAPSTGEGSATEWSTSIGYQIGGFSATVGASGKMLPGNWVKQLLGKVSEDRLCHLWYESLKDNNCPTPSP